MMALERHILCALLTVSLLVLVDGQGEANGNSSIFRTGVNPNGGDRPNMRPSLVPVRVSSEEPQDVTTTPTANIRLRLFNEKVEPVSFDRQSFLEGVSESNQPPGSEPVVSMVKAMRSSDSSSCLNPFPVEFFSLAQKQEAVTLGSVQGQGFLFGQDFRTVCYDRAFRKYRTYDGTCNHPRNYGASFTPVARLLPAEYDDGIALPRTTDMEGKALPSPRLVSLVAHPAENEIRECTLMVMQWGQWLDHDMTGLPVATEFDKSIKCCGENGGCPPFNTDKSCFPIELPPSENNFEGQCMEFVRSIPARDFKGNELVPREQVNSLTSFVDGSQIYGSTPDRAEYLREPDSFLLRSERGGGFLPESIEEECIRRAGTDDYCFVAGDIRVNEQPGLGSMHTMWLREHNRIANLLSLYNTNYDTEEIFQVTRKIVGALQQVITYKEWLPIILGDTVERMHLWSEEGRSSYNPALDPRIINVFSSAAMRFGHSLIPTALPIGDRKVSFRELFNRPAEVLDNFDEVMAGLVGVTTSDNDPTEKLQKVDRNFVREITNFLFVPPNERGTGFDLVALNIQRARDHGIPPYTKWRAFCGLRPLYGFHDVEALGPNVGELATVYKSVDDIDLFSGLMFEPVESKNGGIVGPTLNCLLSIQFFNVKFGDRFFFDNDESNIKFNDAQVAALRQMTLSKIICLNTAVDNVPENAFKFASSSNPLRPCRDLTREGLDLTLFV